MKLLEGIDYASFLKAVQQCEGEVLMVTAEGDQLNLKSTLSQFIFAAALGGKLRLSDAELRLHNQEDRKLLEMFLVKEA